MARGGGGFPHRSGGTLGGAVKRERAVLPPSDPLQALRTFL